jgi:hypothetical protein
MKRDLKAYLYMYNMSCVCCLIGPSVTISIAGEKWVMATGAVPKDSMKYINKNTDPF